MDKGKLFAAFVAIIMISSTIGFALVSNTAGQDSASDNSVPPEPPPTELKFKADDVPAMIVELIPSVQLVGFTKELDIGKIDSAIYGIKGVRSVKSFFSQAQQGLAYVAAISFEKDYNANYIIDSVNEKKILESANGYVFAIIELPKKIVFKSESDALGLSKEYELADNLSNGFAGTNTIKGDEIKVKISATFLGSKLVELVANETQNITAAPIEGIAKLELSLKTLEKKLSFSAKAFFSGLPDKNVLQEKLSEIIDVNSVELDVPGIAPKILVFSSAVLPEEQLHDLNVFVQSLLPQSADFYNSGSFAASIAFDADKNLAGAKQKLEAQLASMAIDANAEESSGRIVGTLFLLNENSKSPFEALSSLLESSALKEIVILQPGTLFLESVADSNSNQVYSVDSNSTQAFVKPGHSIGDKINASISYYLVRNKIDFVFAKED